MTIRTISNLPEYDKTSKEIDPKSLFQISKPVGERGYISTNMPYGRLLSTMTNGLEQNIVNKYSLFNNCGEILSSKVQDILENNGVEIKGTKIFKDFISLDKSSSEITNYPNERILVTRDFVENSAKKSAFVVKQNSKTPNGYVKLEDNYDSFIESTEGKQTYAWRWGYQGNINPKISTTCTIVDSGILVVYGYISAPKKMEPTNSWVAMEARINDNWVMTNLFPWTVGNNSTSMQYVSFTLPVGVEDGKTLDIRFKCGFEPNLETSGFGNQGLVFDINSSSANINTNSMNTMIGYILN